MRKWLRHIRAGFRMGLLWAAAWASVGFLIEYIHDIWPNRLGALVDIWPAALGIPAFFGGLTFSALLAVAGRRRRFSELSVLRFAALGAAGGVLVGLMPAFMILVGFASIHGAYTLWQVTAPIVACCALVGSTSAAGSLLLARRAELQGSLPSGNPAEEGRPERGAS